jgi:chemotaxis signal transduction protein
VGATTGTATLLLPVGDEWHAIEMASVREVLAVPPVAPMPAAPPWLAGLVNVRGELLPAIDTGRALGAGPADATHVAVVDTASGPAAVLATGAPEPGVLGERQGDGGARGSVGQYDVDGRTATALDLDAILSPEGRR